MRIDCTCDESMFTDKMCRPCLKRAEELLENKIENLQEKIDELETDLEQVHYRLYVESEGDGEESVPL